ncbi:hypothetical protein BVY03_01195, partial [bacterium K02(2017)]
YTYGFTKGKPFNINTSPSEVGTLSEFGRQRNESSRTGHPIHSFAVLGFHAKHLGKINNYGGYSQDSPFAELLKLKGKIGVLDVTEDHSMTFYHHVEEMNKVPYRFHKKFTAPYTDINNTTQNKEYSLYVRYLKDDYYIQVDLNPMGERAWKEGLYSGYKPKQESGLRVVKAQELYDLTQHVILKENATGMLYHLKK